MDMIDCSISESPSDYRKQLKQILKYIGVHSPMGYTIPTYFHCFVYGSRGSQIRVIAMEIKNDDPRLEDEYEVTTALKNISEYLKKSRYFILGGGFDGWAEITGVEYKALDILRDVNDDLEILCEDEHGMEIEYDTETCKTKITGKSFRIIYHDINDIDEFLKVVEAMDYIRSGDFYARIKEAKHE